MRSDDVLPQSKPRELGTTPPIHEGSSIDVTLKERGNNYGEYADHAEITQNIKTAMQHSQNWDALPNHLRETLEMLAHKIGRMLNGNPNYLDTVRDIVGYAKLSQDIMEKTNGTTDARVSYVIRTNGQWEPKK